MSNQLVNTAKQIIMSLYDLKDFNGLHDIYAFSHNALVTLHQNNAMPNQLVPPKEDK